MDRDMKDSHGRNGPLELEQMLAYLEGRLSPDEQARMEARIADSPEDAAALEALERQMEGRDSNELLDLEAGFLEGLVGMEGEEENEGPSEEELAFEASMRRQRRGWLLWGAGFAAGIALLMFISLGLLNQKSSPEQLFTDYFTPYEDVYTDRRPIERNPTMDSAIAAYNSADYLEASNGFENIIEIRPGHTLARLYAGISHLAMKQATEAAKFLKPLAEGETDLQPVAAWYLALAELQRGNGTDAKPWLEKVSKGKDKRATDAEKILAKLPE